MKRKQRCPKCAETLLGFLDSLLDSARDRLDVSYQAVGTMSYRPEISIAVKEDLGRSGRHVDATTGSERLIKAGTVEAYVCSRCGLVERYVQDVQWMPFTKLAGFSWVNGPPENTDADTDAEVSS
jgi:hypothetical protein